MTDRERIAAVLDSLPPLPFRAYISDADSQGPLGGPFDASGRLRCMVEVHYYGDPNEVSDAFRSAGIAVVHRVWSSGIHELLLVPDGEDD